MPSIRSASMMSTARGLLAALLVAALALMGPGAGNAQETKQIRLTEKHVQDFMSTSVEMTKLFSGANGDKPDPAVDAEAEALVKKNGFASLAEFDDVSMNISMIMAGIDPQTKRFTEPPEQIRQQIAALKADKSIAEAQRKDELAQLEAALKSAKPITFKENVSVVVKYYDQLAELMQEQGPAD